MRKRGVRISANMKEEERIGSKGQGLGMQKKFRATRTQRRGSAQHIGNKCEANPIKNDLNELKNQGLLRGVAEKGLGRGRVEGKKADL